MKLKQDTNYMNFRGKVHKFIKKNYKKKDKRTLISIPKIQSDNYIMNGVHSGNNYRVAMISKSPCKI